MERRPRFLNKAELALILNHAVPEASMELCRQLFVFAAFTGLAMADILNLKRSQIEQNHKGRLYLRKAREKTKIESLIPLHPIAQKILTLYASTDEKAFPQAMSASWLTKLTRTMGQTLGLKQGLSFLIARHTFATLMLEASVSMESIAKMLGHSSLRNTQIYAQVTDFKIARDLTQVIEQDQLVTLKDMELTSL